MHFLESETNLLFLFFALIMINISIVYNIHIFETLYYPLVYMDFNTVLQFDPRTRNNFATLNTAQNYS